jgi:uncharacterized damage-inducible protein DinB
MILQKASAHILSQLTELVRNIHPQDFTRPSPSLGQSTIGQHLRHTLEFFLCFEKGYEKGLVNYDKRAHDKTIETDTVMALTTMQRISDFVDSLQERTLRLEVSYECDEVETLDTTASRELVYNIEHAVHHMAIMKIGIREVAPYVSLPADFGVAASTIRHQQQAAMASH